MERTYSYVWFRQLWVCWNERNFMIKNIKKIKRDVKNKKATNATNGMQLIANGSALLKKGFGLVISEIFKKN